MVKKKIKHTLELDADYDYDMIGLCSHHNDYRIVWGLNELLDIQLEKKEGNFILSNARGIISQHPFYEFNDAENFLSYFFHINWQQHPYIKFHLLLPHNIFLHNN